MQEHFRNRNEGLYCVSSGCGARCFLECLPALAAIAAHASALLSSPIQDWSRSGLSNINGVHFSECLPVFIISHAIIAVLFAAAVCFFFFKCEIYFHTSKRNIPLKSLPNPACWGSPVVLLSESMTCLNASLPAALQPFLLCC